MVCPAVLRIKVMEFEFLLDHHALNSAYQLAL
jgi:hypothetical protein